VIVFTVSRASSSPDPGGAVVQNTLVPVRREMKQDGKFVQEIKLTNITYSAKLDPEVFQHLQEQ